MARKSSKAKKHTQIENVSIFGIHARMAPLGLIMYSEWFLDAAKLITVSSEIEFKPVRTYLACHSLELALKAFLSWKGHSLTRLSEGEFGHNLETVLAAAEKQGLSGIVELEETQKFQIRRASKYYAEKVFEYPAIGEALSAYPHRPDTGMLIAAADALVAALHDLCLQAE